MQGSRISLVLVFHFSLVLFHADGQTIPIGADTPEPEFLNHSICVGDSETLSLGYLKGAYSIRAISAVLSVKLNMHIPCIHGESSPIFLKFGSYPGYMAPTAFRTIHRGGDTWTAEVEFSDLASYDYVEIPFEAWTLKKHKTYRDLPSAIDIASLDSLDDSLDNYLQASSYIQSDHSKIIEKANELAGASTNLVDIVRNILNYTGNIIPYKGGTAQDALTTLNQEFAVCTGKANLAVALCRALGIPARVLMVAVTHYVSEIYFPGYGWVLGESTAGYFPWPFHWYTYMMKCTQYEENYSGYLGVMCYWGTDQSRVSYDILYDKCEKNESLKSYDKEESTVDRAMALAQTVWRFYHEYLNMDKDEDDIRTFEAATGFQEDAVNAFLEDDFDRFMICLEHADSVYHSFSSAVEPESANTHFQLFNNYPNPFNPETRIRFQLQKPGHVKLEILNLLGQVIDTPLEGWVNGGTHAQYWGGARFPSGVYFYRLTHNNQCSMGKMMLIK